MGTGGRDRVAEALPAYLIGEELGRGAFGVVWAAQHRQIGRRVAIKELSATEPGVRARFLAEAKVLASLAHPHVVPLYDYVEAGDLCLLVMERLDGGTLANRFFSPHQVDIASACAVAMVTCAGLHHAHLRGVLHRDVKPENLLFSADDVLMITDFGIAKVMGVGSTSTIGGLKGTPAYMAPEQVSGEEPGPGVDIYATGVLLYELLSAHLPFSEQGTPVSIALRRLSEDPEPLELIAPDLAGPLAEATMRALSRDPAERFGSAEEFGVAIGVAATRVLGPGWLDDSKVELLTAGRILDSARRPAASAGSRVTTDRSVTVPPRAVGITTEAEDLAPAEETPRPDRSSLPGVTAEPAPRAEQPSLPGLTPERARPRRGALVALTAAMAAILVASVATAAVRLSGNGTAKSPVTTTTTRPASTTTSTQLGPGTTLHPPPPPPPPPPSTCRNDYLGYQIVVPTYVYASPDSDVLGPCEALDARPLKSGDDLTNGAVTSPLVFFRVSGTLDEVLKRDGGYAPPSVRHADVVDGRPAVVTEGVMTFEEPGYSVGARRYTYYVNTAPTVLVVELLISPQESASAYLAHKQLVDGIMSSLRFVPTVCRNLHKIKCGEFYWNADASNHPVTVTVTTAPATVHVGDTVTLTATAHNPDADVLACTPFFGDEPRALPRAGGPPAGTIEEIRDRTAPVGTFGPWDPPPRVPTTKTFTFTHAYKAAGQYTAGADCSASSSASKAAGDPYDPYFSIGTGHTSVTVS